MSLENINRFDSFFLVWMPLFSCQLHALDRTTSKTSGHPRLVSHLREKTFGLLTKYDARESMMLGVDVAFFFLEAIFPVEEVLPIPSLLSTSFLTMKLLFLHLR